MSKTERVRRTAINGPRNVLTVKGQEPGYRYRIVNDTGDRIKEMEELGYELVSDKNIKVGDKRVAVPTAEGSHIRSAVGTHPSGEPMYGYVMRIKDEWYQEDQQAKQKQVDELEATMKKDAKRNSDYGDIKISRD